MRRELAVLAAAFVITLPLITPRIYASDEVQYFAYLRSLWFDHDVSFENEYQHFWDAGVARSQGFHETYLERQTETGRRISFATIGAAILWSPFYAVADALVGVGLAGGGVRDGYGPRLRARRRVRLGGLRLARDRAGLGDGAPPRPGPRRPRGRARRLVRHAADLLHVRRAADGARLPGLRGGGLPLRVAARARTLVDRRRRGAGRDRRADGDGARAGSPDRPGAGARLGAGVVAGAGGHARPAATAARRTCDRGARGVRDRLRAAALGLHGLERLSVPLAPGRAQVELVRAARLRRVRVARARARVLDAAGAARHHRARGRRGRLVRVGGATDADPPPRERLDGVARALFPDRRRVADLRRRQRRVVDGRRRVRATPLRRPVRGLPRRTGGAVADHGPPRRRAARQPRAGAHADGGDRAARPGHVVEPRPDGAVRRRAHGSAAADAGRQRVPYVRDRPAPAARARLPLRLRAALLLRAAARGLTGAPDPPAPASPAPTTPQ